MQPGDRDRRAQPCVRQRQRLEEVGRVGEVDHRFGPIGPAPRAQQQPLRGGGGGHIGLPEPHGRGIALEAIVHQAFEQHLGIAGQRHHLEPEGRCAPVARHGEGLRDNLARSHADVRVAHLHHGAEVTHHLRCHLHIRTAQLGALPPDAQPVLHQRTHEHQGTEVLAARRRIEGDGAPPQPTAHDVEPVGQPVHLGTEVGQGLHQRSMRSLQQGSITGHQALLCFLHGGPGEGEAQGGAPKAAAHHRRAFAQQAVQQARVVGVPGLGHGAQVTRQGGGHQCAIGHALAARQADGSADAALRRCDGEGRHRARAGGSGPARRPPARHPRARPRARGRWPPAA